MTLAAMLTNYVYLDQAPVMFAVSLFLLLLGSYIGNILKDLIKGLLLCNRRLGYR